MAHVFCYWPRPFFYAFGNTPPICITDNLLPEEDANILLLGCGDVRNILYTMFSDEAHGGNGKAKLDITCCDVDPGVLARNILLLSLLADDQDGKHTDSIRNFYYDIYITNDTLKLVTEQAKKLAALATIDDWQGSSYGSWMRMCTESTLTTLNGLWSRYANVATFSGAQKDKYFAKYSKGVKEIRTGIGKDKSGINLNIGEAIRAAGCLGMGNADFMISLDECRKQSWDMGPTKKAPNPNPTFAYTGRGEEFTLHYSSNYVLGYHLVPALVACNPPQKAQKITSSTLQTLARTQFSDWCKSFRTGLNASFAKGNITLRFFSGNLTALCTALQFSESGSTRPGIYTHGWSATEMVLNSTDYGKDASDSTTRAPTQFNFIDTSNLIDHVGLLNLLITAAPLLLPGPTSVLCTESFKFEGASGMDALSNRICGDPLLLGTIFGVFPSPYFAGFTSRSSTEDSLMRNMGDNRDEGSAFERTQWKHLQPAFSDEKEYAPSKLTMDPKQLAGFLYNIYLKMFEKESFTTGPKLYYIRETFSKLLLIIKSRIESNWEAAMEILFMGYISTDKKVFMTMNNIQDLNTHLQLNGLFELPVPDMCKSVPSYETGPKQMQGWKTIPNIVTISLVVPREHVAILLNGDHSMGSPILQADVQCKAGHNQYHSLQLVFGKVFAKTNSDSGETELRIEQDQEGCFGSQDLIVIFQVPSWTLRLFHETCTVALGLHSTPEATLYFVKKLGLMLRLYQARLAETEKVFVSKLPPNISTKRAGSSIVFPKRNDPPFQNKFELQAEIRLNKAANKLETLALKITGFSEGHAKELADGAKVSNDVRSSNSVRLRFGTFDSRLAFPLPVNGSSLKTRIARKSQFVELIASVGDVDHEKFPVGQQKRFPIVQHGQNLALWNLHRLSLNTLPVMNLLVDHSKWVSPGIGSSLSKREREILSKEDTTGDLSDTMVGVKDTINHLFLHSVNSRKMHGVRTFLILPKPKSPFDRLGGDFLIFVTDMKLDLANSTLVLDACILPFNREFRENREIAKFVAKGHARKEIMNIAIGPKEHRIWKELICSFIERARGNSYTHHPTKCEYLKNGKDGQATVPLSYEDGKIPFCSCGRGKASPEFLAVKEWKPLAKFVTRAAISPLFYSELREVGSMEGVLQSPSDMLNNTNGRGAKNLKNLPVRDGAAEKDQSELEMMVLEEMMRRNMGF